MTVDYLEAKTIIGMKIYWAIDPDDLQFAIASSSMMMTWQRAVGGRLKSDPSFSNTLVWNTFPLPVLTDKDRDRMAEAGQDILEVRSAYAGSTLADLYHPTSMPSDLLKAHRALDSLVDHAFGLGPSPSTFDRQRCLFEHYIQATTPRS